MAYQIRFVRPVRYPSQGWYKTTGRARCVRDMALTSAFATSLRGFDLAHQG